MQTSKDRDSQPILVVGAGPVGLVGALALRHHGLPVMVLEADPYDRLRPGSRAIFLHRASLGALDEIAPGVAPRLAQEGLVWPEKRTLFRGKEVYKKTYPPPTPGQLPPFTSLSQVVMERCLLDACVAAGVQFSWNCRIERVRVNSDRVRVTDDGGHLWETDYVIGADGAQSRVRHQVGIAMEGTRSPNTFIVVDVRENPENPLPVARVFHYEHPAVGGRNVLMVPFAGGWRIDLQLHEGDDVDAFNGPDGVRHWLPLVMDKAYAERMSWISSYQFLQVVATAFTDPQHRVLLVGEAAHLFAPFGARGLNSGIIDAISAAKAISEARRASPFQDPAVLIQGFAEDRGRAGRYNRDAAGMALEHMQGTAPGMRLKRYLGAALAPVWPDLGRWLDEGPYGPRFGPSATTKY